MVASWCSGSGLLRSPRGRDFGLSAGKVRDDDDFGAEMGGAQDDLAGQPAVDGHVVDADDGRG